MVHTYLVHSTYPTLKPRLVEHTHNFFWGDVAIRNSLRSNKKYPPPTRTHHVHQYYSSTTAVHTALHTPTHQPTMCQVFRLNRFSTCVEAHWFSLHRIWIWSNRNFYVTDIFRYVRVRFLVGCRPRFSSSGYPEIATCIFYFFPWLGRLALPSGPTALTQDERYRRYVIEIHLL